MTARLVVVVGNPKAGSKTLGVAKRVAKELAGDGDVDLDVIDLATMTSELFDWGSPTVGTAAERVVAANVAVFASPVYKATYTGMLKVFLDRFGAGSLQGLVAVPLLVGGAPGHALAVEVHLRPLLVELGATCVTPGLFVLESSIPDLDAQLHQWLPAARPLVAEALS